MFKQRQILCVSLLSFDDGLPPSLCLCVNLNNVEFKAHHYADPFMD